MSTRVSLIFMVVSFLCLVAFAGMQMDKVSSMYTHQQLEDSVQAAKESYLDELEQEFILTPRDEQTEEPMLTEHSQIKPEDTMVIYVETNNGEINANKTITKTNK